LNSISKAACFIERTAGQDLLLGAHLSVSLAVPHSELSRAEARLILAGDNETIFLVAAPIFSGFFL
jgi:hypothetical protein